MVNRTLNGAKQHLIPHTFRKQLIIHCDGSKSLVTKS